MGVREVFLAFGVEAFPVVGAVLELPVVFPAVLAAFLEVALAAEGVPVFPVAFPVVADSKAEPLEVFLVAEAGFVVEPEVELVVSVELRAVVAAAEDHWMMGEAETEKVVVVVVVDGMEALVAPDALDR